MKTSYDIVKSVLRTEKSTRLLAENKYLFLVNKFANKIEIKKAVEEIFNVNVVSVNIMNMKGKPKRVRFKLGKTPDWKKALVTLKQGDTIDIAST